MTSEDGREAREITLKSKSRNLNTEHSILLHDGDQDQIQESFPSRSLFQKLCVEAQNMFLGPKECPSRSRQGQGKEKFAQCSRVQGISRTGSRCAESPMYADANAKDLTARTEDCRGVPVKNEKKNLTCRWLRIMEEGYVQQSGQCRVERLHNIKTETGSGTETGDSLI